jgi:PAS domain S-box-containing protein
MIGENGSTAVPASNLSSNAGEELRLAPLWLMVRNIHIIVVLVTVCAVTQLAILWRVCAGGMRASVALLGVASIVISLGAVLFVLIANRRTRTQLLETSARLNERTGELTASLSLLRATLDSTADAMVVIDQQNRVTSFNDKFTKLWGIAEDALRAKRGAELAVFCSLQTRNPELFLKQIGALETVGQAVACDGIELADGRWVEGWVNPQWNGGERLGVVLSFRDITQHKLAEVELGRERNRLRALMNGSDDCIYFKDAQSRFICCSANMARNFHMQSVDEVLGKSDFDFFAEVHAREALADEQKIMLTGERLAGKVEKETWPDGRVTWALTSKMPLRDEKGDIVGTLGISKDITPIKEAEAKLSLVHKQLMEASREAGMAEVATSVLHNVGNVLNSVNVSSSLIADKIRNSKAANLAKIVVLLRAHEADLGNFFANDPKGRQLLEYLPKLSAYLAQEQEELLHESAALVANVVHIKEIVSMQQNYARSSGVLEMVELQELVQDAIRMNNGSLDRHNVKVRCEFEKVPPILTEKHKVLQILVNLLRNAKHACDDSGRDDKLITLRLANGDGRVKIAVIDNGVGIPPENLTRIFNHGFTTRKEGHGFGLHSGANAAKELGGALTANSGGPGSGATFLLELPVKFQKSNS